MCSIVYVLDLYHMYAYDVYYSKKLISLEVNIIHIHCTNVGNIQLLMKQYPIYAAVN